MPKTKTDKILEMSEEELLYELLWKKHKAIDPHKVISSESLPNGAFVVKIGGQKISEVELANLQSEAKMIEGTRMWKLAVETLSAAAEDSIFKSSKNMEDIHWGKSMLFNISVLKNIFTIVKRPNLNKSPQEVSQERFAKTRYQSGLSPESPST